MTEAQIHARAVIASAVIQKDLVTVNNVHQWKGPIAECPALTDLRAYVDVIFNAVKLTPKSKSKR